MIRMQLTYDASLNGPNADSCRAGGPFDMLSLQNSGLAL